MPPGGVASVETVEMVSTARWSRGDRFGGVQVLSLTLRRQGYRSKLREPGDAMIAKTTPSLIKSTITEMTKLPMAVPLIRIPNKTPRPSLPSRPPSG